MGLDHPPLSGAGRGDFPSLTWSADDMLPYARTGEVDTVDGLIMVLSPWTVRNVRFDESLGSQLHGYDFDLCLQVQRRPQGPRRESACHPPPLAGAGRRPGAVCSGPHAGRREVERAVPHVGSAPGDWKQRSRRAEAEAAATRAQVRSWQLQIESRIRRHDRALREVAESTSLRVTAPLRRLKAAAGSRSVNGDENGHGHAVSLAELNPAGTETASAPPEGGRTNWRTKGLSR